jgi:S-adenosyl-L-methionine hydrolase (adenosine-forming)
MLITLTTDFGYRDSFVGVMKGVILGINAAARIIDLTHDIPPQDIRCAALMLRHAVPYFPDGTIHIAVGDPGVGSERRPLLIQSENRYLIGPDNGVLSLAFRQENPDCAVCLSNPKYHLKPTSATFHGRDVFSPVAAYLTLGMPPAAFGDRVDEFVRLSLPTASKSAGTLEGEIVYIDRFGNLFTNIEERDLAGVDRDQVTISLGAVSMHGIGNSYSAAREGDYVAVINSWGALEIAVYRGSAQQRAQARLGDKVRVASHP